MFIVPSSNLGIAWGAGTGADSAMIPSMVIAFPSDLFICNHRF